jgi:superfamily II DNA or RNA helicase
MEQRLASANANKYNIHSCLSNKYVKPHVHQERVVKFLLKNKYRKGILIFHGVGTGKTLTSIFMARCLMIQYPQSSVIVLTPTSLVGNYTKELDKFGLTEEEVSRIDISTYGKFINKLKNGSARCDNSIVIIDEAHNFRSYGKDSKMIMHCTDFAKKVVLLSATPIHNDRTDIVNLLTMVTQYTRLEVIAIMNSYKKDLLAKLYGCNLSYYKTRTDSKDFAKQVVHVKYFRMDDDFYADYYAIQENLKVKGLPEEFMKTKNLTVFLNGIRRASNKISKISPKFEWAISKVKEDISNNKKVLIYSNWIEHGVVTMKRLLREHKIKYAEITGSLSSKVRDSEVKKYNEGIVNVMIITSAGGEGISLTNTRTVLILEPHWNNQKNNQIMGRAIRYRSHTSLPAADRKVDVYFLILKKPQKLYQSDDIELSADEILYDMSLRKDIEIQKFYREITRYAIENNTRCKQ